MVRICPFCENGIEITEIKSYPDYSRKFFSCGHIDKPNKKDLSSHNDKMADLSPRISRDMNGENTVNISPLAAIGEKTISGKRWLQFSGESIRFAISNEEINIQLLETKFSERINPEHISNSILALSNEIKTNSIVTEKERKKILGLFETLNNILVSEPKRIIIGRKWNFSLTSPYILKTIEILTGSSINE
jgi:hypothetical protein